MNTREKLFLLWAVLASVLFLGAAFVVGQMLLPRFADTAQLMYAAEMEPGATVLYQCSRAAKQCAPTNQAAHYVEFANAAGNGAIEDYTLLWVTHDTPTEWRAFSPVSTHLGCFVMWQPTVEQFRDPCGGAAWARDGKYEFGPAPRDLDSFPVRVQNGAVFIEFKLVRGKNIN